MTLVFIVSRYLIASQLILVALCPAAMSSPLKDQDEKLRAEQGINLSLTQAEKATWAQSIVQMVRESIRTEPRNVLSYTRDIPRHLINEGLQQQAREIVLEFTNY